MIRRILWLLPLVLLAAHAFLGFSPGQYREGYDQAMKDMEDVRENLGWASEIDGSILDHVQYLPAMSEKPERWQEGYRQAVRDQFTPLQR
jgi:hypothetical protein